jgi:hypothetical protein
MNIDPDAANSFIYSTLINRAPICCTAATAASAPTPPTVMIPPSHPHLSRQWMVNTEPNAANRFFFVALIVRDVETG